LAIVQTFCFQVCRYCGKKTAPAESSAAPKAI
jgi:hypothetical protein